jgi:hypothetical protein
VRPKLGRLLGALAVLVKPADYFGVLLGRDHDEGPFRLVAGQDAGSELLGELRRNPGLPRQPEERFRLRCLPLPALVGKRRDLRACPARFRRGFAALVAQARSIASSSGDGPVSSAAAAAFDACFMLGFPSS